jgi:CRP-like cAMP-binding protein
MHGSGRLSRLAHAEVTAFPGLSVRTDRVRKTDATISHRPSARIGSAHPEYANQLFLRSVAVAGTAVSFSQDDEIYDEGEPAVYAYKVVSGAVRTCKLLPDGRRQVAAFHLPGDVFGLELGSELCLSAEAISATTVLIFSRDAIVDLADRDKDAAQDLWRLTARQLQQAQRHALLLVKNAQERVAAFLLDMAARTASQNTVNLPMSRQDIADYLGLTIETVSRTLTQLEKDAAIALQSSRCIVLRDRASLKRLNG